MMRWASFLLLPVGIGLMFSVTVFSQGQNNVAVSDPDVQRLDGQARQFFGFLAEDRVSDAFDDLLIDSPALERSPSIDDLKKSAQEISRRFGPNLGVEQVQAKRVGQDVIALAYLYKCERFPLVWRFTYYRTADVDEMAAPTMNWKLIALSFDTDLAKLAQEIR